MMLGEIAYMHIATISAVSIIAGYGLDIRGSISDRGMIFLFTASSVSGVHRYSYLMGTGGALSSVLMGQGVKMTTHFHLVPISRRVELYFHFSIRLHEPITVATRSKA
jgi:hypothetical protein